MHKKRISTKILQWAKKVKAIEILGGKCEHCGNYNIFQLTFHHTDSTEKKYNINDIIDHRWSLIEKEIKKCKLLCHNCHNELHHPEQTTIYSTNKKLFLEIKSNSGCELCYYNKNNSALHIHHTNEKDITFGKITTEFKTIEDISDEIVNKLETCQILCANCHIELHTDIEFFHKYKEEIYLKAKTLQEKQSKLDRNLVKKLYNNGTKQHEIAKFLNCSKSVICDIIKELNINTEHRMDTELIRKLYYDDGLRQIDIAKKLNCGKSTIQYQLIQLKKIYGDKI